MRALRLNAWKSAPRLVEVPVPEPGPGQVLLRVRGAGACHSDLHVMHEFEQGMLPWSPPFTLGHENTGTVVAVGTGVTTVDLDDDVAVYGPWGCGTCSSCRSGAENYCGNPARAPVPAGGGGLGLDGGMAEFMLVPHERLLVRLPAGLDPVLAAPLTDAGLTPYHAVKRSWPKMPPGSTTVVIGVGGLGHLAVQTLRATTATWVVAVDQDPLALDRALGYGAETVLAPEVAHEGVRSSTEGRGADVVLDFVGSQASLDLAASCVRALGDLTIVGLGGGTLPLSFFSLPYEVSVQTTYWGSRPELAEVLDLADRRLLVPHITRYDLADAPQAYEDLLAGKVDGRAVIVP